MSVPLSCPKCFSPLAEKTSDAHPYGVGPVAKTYLACTACPRTFPVLWGVPYMGEFREEHVKSMIEITSIFSDLHVADDWQITKPDGGVVTDLRDQYFSTQDMIDETPDANGTGLDWSKYGRREKPHWFGSRYNEFAAFRQFTHDIDFSGKKLLDIGAGRGFDALRCQKRGAQVTALEYNPIQAAVGHQNFPEFQWLGGCVNLLPFGDEEFDIVLANASLHHVIGHEEAISEMLRILRPGGYFLSMSDSVSPDHFTESDEVDTFNHHNPVLNGVNEQIPRYVDLMKPFEAQGDAIKMTAGNMVVHGVMPNTGEMRMWQSMDQAAALLRKHRGDLNLRVRKVAPTKSIRTVDAADVLPVVDYALALKDKSTALTALAPVLHNGMLDQSLASPDQSKWRLLLGWRKRISYLGYREIQSPAFHFVSGREAKRLHNAIEVRRPAGMTLPVSVSVLIDGDEVAQLTLTGSSWQALSFPENSASDAVNHALEFRATISNNGIDENCALYIRDRTEIRPGLVAQATNKELIQMVLRKIKSAIPRPRFGH